MSGRGREGGRGEGGRREGGREGGNGHEHTKEDNHIAYTCIRRYLSHGFNVNKMFSAPS